ncbi:MAG: hypothetical protein PHO80_00125 [Candidatus Gracilibacteria bacterium]|nr:hypothetical protein [Candidatus Gracilibacteria bacterium]
MLKRNKNGIALILGILVVCGISTIAVFLLERITGISNNTKGIENSTIAYYNAVSAIEEGLFNMTKTNPGAENSGSGGSIYKGGYSYVLKAMALNVPESEEGNSIYDRDYNIISPFDPIELTLPATIIAGSWNNIKFQFKTPSLGGTTTLSGGTGSCITWVLYGSGTTAFASGSQITFEKIDNTEIILGGKSGVSLTGSGNSFKEFYDSNDSINPFYCNQGKCKLKLFLVDKLVNTNGQPIPFLEYKITGFSNAIPSEYATITANGYSYGFKKTIILKRQQLTTSEYFDYTVFN